MIKLEEEVDYAIETSQLVKKFGDFKALDGMNLKVKKGEIYGLLGPNGAGKTTTIRVLCGLSNASSGKAQIFGKTVPNSAISKLIGYMIFSTSSSRTSSSTTRSFSTAPAFEAVCTSFLP